jgi:hypothetical protein
MKCISCSGDINPQWTHAIEINVCPFCGKHIMEEHLKNLFATLRSTMESLAQYPDQLNDWMLSNHQFIKTDSPNLIDFVPKEQLQVKPLKREASPVEDELQENKKFIVKVKTEAGVEEEVVAEKIQSEERTNDFFKRAEVIKPRLDGFQSPAQKNEHLKKMAEQIKRAGSTALNSEGAASIISPEMMENADPEAVAELESILSGDLITSSLSDNTGDEIPDVVLRMASGASGKGNGKASAADLLKLQQQQQRVRASRENFESGTNRGGKGGGFSRST